MFEKTKRFCDSFLTLGLPGFDLAVYRDGECILRYMGGYSDLENKVPVQGNERYNIYSTSKPITCTAGLQLCEKGLFSLDDKLSDYMPEFRDMTVITEKGVVPCEKPILIRHLFEMTAGFSYDTESPWLVKCREETGGKCPTRTFMTYLAKEPLLFTPGERWEYSLCHDVLAGLVEVVSGEKFEDYVKKNIFDVLGMKNSTFMLPKEELATVAEQYRFEGGAPVNIGKEIVPYKCGTEFASGGAGGISTVDDYIKFLEGLRTGKLLSPETLTLMATNRLTETQTDAYWLKHAYGYGLGVRCAKDGSEFGWDGAAGAYSALDVKNGISIFLGSHLQLSPAQGPRLLLYRVIRAELFGEDFTPIKNDLKKLYEYDLTF